MPDDTQLPRAGASGPSPDRPEIERPEIERPKIEPARRPFWKRISWVWIMPVLALAVSLGVAYRSFAGRGTLIDITFADASGIKPGETTLRFREVEVGRVESVDFTKDLTGVIVGVRMQPDVVPYLDRDAEFWIARAEVSTSGISRLDTVLSGVFIEGTWDSQVDDPIRSFKGLADAPLVTSPNSGTTIRLSSDAGGALINGAPVLYHGIQVGKMQNLRLSDVDDGVAIDALIESPYDTKLTTSSVFWETSGFSLSLGAQGLTFDVKSLAALIQGGVEFDTNVSGGEAVEPGQAYRLFPDEATARQSVFVDTLAVKVRVSVLLDKSVTGLSKGTQVMYQGLPVGEVTGLSVRVTPNADQQPVARQQVNLALGLDRMGFTEATTDADGLASLGELVKGGLRARVSSTGILGQSLIIELVEIPDVPPGVIDTAAKPFPLLPSAPSAVKDANATAEGVFARINALPVEDLMQSAINLLDTINGFVAKDGTQRLPDEAAGLIADARRFVGSDGVQKVPQQLTDTLAELQGVLGDLRDGGAVTNVNGALASANRAAGAVEDATNRLPDVIRRVDAAVATLNDTLASYGNRSPFNDETLATLREVRKAAESIGSLSKTIERNPQAFILGR